jgi:hypothetical protein
MFTLKDLQNKVEKGISEYIEFDVKDIFEQSDYITIYGGAVRDSIAGLEIHDVDILCMSESAKILAEFIEERDFKKLDLYDLDTHNMYKGISLIEEPWTFMNKNRKIIQIIRPRYASYSTKLKNSSEHKSKYQIAYYNLIKNVDLSCCGVFLENFGVLDGGNFARRIRLKEACKSAIIHCISKTFEIQNWTKLYNEKRTLDRAWKLENRGWENINGSSSAVKSLIDKGYNLKRLRKLKLIELEFEPEYDFKIWSEDEYLNNVYLDL